MRRQTSDGDDMKTRISALADGELEEHEIAEALGAVKHSEELRAEWHTAHLIGAALREEGHLSFDVTARVMSALEQEPVVLAPRPAPRRDWGRPALALAASVAGVTVVAWLGLGPAADTDPGAGLAQAPTAAPVVVARAQATPRLQEYLVAHHAYAPAGPAGGGARNIRTVSVGSENR